MKPSREDITVVIITKNESKTIRDVVTVWRRLAPVLVVDSHSWDDTVGEAKLGGAEVISQRWLGFGKQKQFAVEAATTDWVLSIDADEIPDDRLLNALQSIDLEDPTISYILNRETYFLGKKVRHCGWSNDLIVRLFHKNHGHFDERIVHEKVVHSGPSRELKGSLIHHSYRRTRDVYRKLVRYSRLSARHMLSDPKPVGSIIISSIISPFWSAFKVLVLKTGWLDGLTGFQIARMQYLTTRRKYQIVKKVLKVK